MGYCFNFNNQAGGEFSVHRSRHTGDWLLQERNSHYGYFATMHSFGQRLGFEELRKISIETGVALEVLVERISADVRSGNDTGMRPNPGFDFRAGHTV